MQIHNFTVTPLSHFCSMIGYAYMLTEQIQKYIEVPHQSDCWSLSLFLYSQFQDSGLRKADLFKSPFHCIEPLFHCLIFLIRDVTCIHLFV